MSTTEKKETWQLDREGFGPLWTFIENENITDIDWDGSALWVTDIDDRRTKIENPEIDRLFAIRFTERVANHSGKPFNRTNVKLETEVDTLRLTCIHEEFARSGRCFFIRKTSSKLRFTANEAIKKGFCDEKGLHLLVNCIESNLNMSICGEPGDGKTEWAKFMSSFIHKEQMTITVEDSAEWHYGDINPGARHVELIVKKQPGRELTEEYSEAIYSALRMTPTWLNLGECRGREVNQLFEGFATGVNGINTLHLDDVRNAEERFCSMVGSGLEEEQLRKKIGMFLNVGILMRRKRREDETKYRCVSQICFFDRVNGENKCYLVYDNGKWTGEQIPEKIINKMKLAGIEDPFTSPLLLERMESEKEFCNDKE